MSIIFLDFLIIMQIYMKALNSFFYDKSFKNRPESFLFVLINVKALMSC
jgi:hypothetical protein